MYRMDNKGPTSQQKASTSAEDELSKKLEATSIKDSEQLQSDTEILGKIIHFFKKAQQTSKKEVKPLEVAKACIGQNASTSSINRYLHRLADMGVLSVTFQKNPKGQNSKPSWSALSKIEDITETRIFELASKMSSSPKKGVKSGQENVDKTTVTNMSPGKNDSGASKITGSDEKTNLVAAIQAQAYPFSKGIHNQKDVLSSIIRAEVSKSVGLIHIDGQSVGTGFRVGDKYLVTCGHVIQNAIKVKPYILDGERLEIEFYRIAYNQREDPRLIFGFQPLVAYFDDDYDFVVLELRSYDAGVPYPPALTCFADVSVSEIHLVGHPGGRQMKEDSVDPKWSPVHDKEIIPYIEDLARWSMEYFPDKRDYYSILLEPPRKIMFHTTFDTGSSGSPGVIIRNKKPCVAVMVRGGTPGCFYENTYPDLKVEDRQKVEYGYAMADIFLKMLESSQQNIKDLASEIFKEWN